MAFYVACNVMPKLSKMLVAIKSFENLDLHHGKQCYASNQSWANNSMLTKVHHCICLPSLLAIVTHHQC
jgi:hypothetical protein